MCFLKLYVYYAKNAKNYQIFLKYIPIKPCKKIYVYMLINVMWRFYLFHSTKYDTKKEHNSLHHFCSIKWKRLSLGGPNSQCTHSMRLIPYSVYRTVFPHSLMLSNPLNHSHFCSSCLFFFWEKVIEFFLILQRPNKDSLCSGVIVVLNDAP